MFEIVRDYTFLTVVIGTVVLAMTSSIVGTITVLNKQSLIGDLLGHAAYPGVILAFMVFDSRQPLLLMSGAMVSGYLSYYLLHWLSHRHRQSFTNSLAVLSAAFFGLGMVLKQFVQGNSHFANSTQAGLQTYLFGQAAFIKGADVLVIVLTSVACLLLYSLYYQRYRLYLFDPLLAQLSGISTNLLAHLTRLMMIALISVGLKVVGTVLMSAFLIAPASLGLMWGKTYTRALLLSASLAGLSALMGTFASSVVSGLSTGPSIIVSMSLLAGLLSLYRVLRRGGNYA